jgi:hypothetical protein
MARRWLSKVTAVINRLLPSQASSRFGTAGLITEAFKSASWKLVPGLEATVRDPHFQVRIAEVPADLARPRGLLDTDLEVAFCPVSGKVYYLVPGTPLPPLPAKS